MKENCAKKAFGEYEKNVRNKGRGMGRETRDKLKRNILGINEKSIAK